jgi:hypothetical protein
MKFVIREFSALEERSSQTASKAGIALVWSLKSCSQNCERNLLLRAESNQRTHPVLYVTLLKAYLTIIIP